MTNTFKKLFSRKEDNEHWGTVFFDLDDTKYDRFYDDVSLGDGLDLAVCAPDPHPSNADATGKTFAKAFQQVSQQVFKSTRIHDAAGTAPRADTTASDARRASAEDALACQNSITTHLQTLEQHGADNASCLFTVQAPNTTNAETQPPGLVVFLDDADEAAPQHAWNAPPTQLQQNKPQHAKSKPKRKVFAKLMSKLRSIKNPVAALMEQQHSGNGFGAVLNKLDRLFSRRRNARKGYEEML